MSDTNRPTPLRVAVVGAGVTQHVIGAIRHVHAEPRLAERAAEPVASLEVVAGEPGPLLVGRASSSAVSSISTQRPQSAEQSLTRPR